MVLRSVQRNRSVYSESGLSGKTRSAYRLRMFEAAGVARTERSIVNWCQMNSQGVARLDAYFDPNERKYFISAQSVKLAIAEEKAKAAKSNASSEPVGNVPQASESEAQRDETDAEAASDQVRHLEKEVMDLKITNRAKDYFIDQLQKEREAFTTERQGYVEKLMSFNHRMDELETQLLQLTEPEERPTRKLEVRPQFEDSRMGANEP